MINHIVSNYKDAHPFPHCVVDNFLDTNTLANAIATIPLIEEANYICWENSAQKNKKWISNPTQLPKQLGDVLLYMNSQEVLSWLEVTTGIPNLLADPGYMGGGLHRITRGGKLAIHCDFNIHPDTGWHRRLNALLFLNKNWEESWGGNLELWTPDMRVCEANISPIFNRLAVFSTTDTSFHGHPEPLACPYNRARYSLALYYYTLDRPEHEKSPSHGALWQKRLNA